MEAGVEKHHIMANAYVAAKQIVALSVGECIFIGIESK